MERAERGIKIQKGGRRKGKRQKRKYIKNTGITVFNIATMRTFRSLHPSMRMF
jgi:hypothetical protein